MRQYKHRRSSRVSIFKEVEETPEKYLGTLCPTNLAQQKEQFLKFGTVPNFKMKCSPQELEKITSKKRGQISFDLLEEAKHIIDVVKRKFGDGSKYMEAAFGPHTDFVTATEILALYLTDCNCDGELTIYWTPNLECSAKMMWHGPNLRFNKPEARKFTLIIKNSTENSLLRELGISCLADHEIGTHYMRMINDGLQPWYSDRKKFGLRPLSSRELCSTEEGLATLNTQINARHRYLWKSAITYYTACMAAEMSFKELYNHLELYIKDKEQRWKQVMRVKRGLTNVNDHGGCGNDQVYFEGAVEIIRNIENIDFQLLYSGKVCVDELTRVKRLARLDCIRTPRFLRDIEKYKKRLRSIGYINGLMSRPEKKVDKCINVCKSPPKSVIRQASFPGPPPFQRSHRRYSTLHGGRSITPASSGTYSPVPSHKSAPVFSKISEDMIPSQSRSSMNEPLSENDDGDECDTAYTDTPSKSMTPTSGARLLHRPQHVTHKLRKRHSKSRKRKVNSTSPK